MRKILPFLIVVATAVYLTPLYPVYAQEPAATSTTAIPEPSVKRIVKPLTKPASGAATLRPGQVINKLDNIQDRVLNAREKMASRAAELKLKLQKFRDKAKAGRVENISSNLNAINLRRTSDMQQNLSRISAIVAKLKTWAATQEAAGKDMTGIKKIISDTESLWTEADSAVKAQADKDYTIEVNTETTVKTDAQAARNNLGTDLKSVHDKLVSVRQNLANALSNWKGGI